jgi:putative ABC transport system permease protein
MLDLKPYDLALLDISEELEEYKARYPSLDWVERINFGALLDVPDEQGETLRQGEVIGFAIDLFTDDSEAKRLQLDSALQSGRIPDKPGEILLSAIAAEKLQVGAGDGITLIGSTVFGAMSMQNFVISGTVEFGILSLDQGAVVADLSDIRQMLDMEDAAGEILAFFKSGEYERREAARIRNDFNLRYSDSEDEFSPQMLRLSDQGNIGYILTMLDYSVLWMSFGFIIVLGIVLWNAGLLNSIRRYGEFGVRLAIGESKRRVYWSLLIEAIIVGIVGGILGVLLGSAISLYFNNIGMDMSVYNKGSNMLSENMLYTSLNAYAVIVSFIPGVLSTILGAALAGIAIFKRQTSQLFKELET